LTAFRGAAPLSARRSAGFATRQDSVIAPNGISAPVFTRQGKGVCMSIIAWLVLGLISGFIGSKIVDNQGRGVIGDIIVGILGAFLGGFLFNLFGASGVTGLNLYSILVSVAGSVVLLWVFYTYRGSRNR
jgi:uncharacterized membrane protein YeaQ/YmgE (transglycosylase-associated protein family)